MEKFYSVHVLVGGSKKELPAGILTAFTAPPREVSEVIYMRGLFAG